MTEEPRDDKIFLPNNVWNDSCVLQAKYALGIVKVTFFVKKVCISNTKNLIYILWMMYSPRICETVELKLNFISFGFQ